jgi:hypothetical protein
MAPTPKNIFKTTAKDTNNLQKKLNKRMRTFTVAEVHTTERCPCHLSEFRPRGWWPQGRALETLFVGHKTEDSLPGGSGDILQIQMALTIVYPRNSTSGTLLTCEMARNGAIIVTSLCSSRLEIANGFVLSVECYTMVKKEAPDL